MKLTIEVNRSMFRKLSPSAFTVLIYCTAYYKKNVKIPSMKHIAKEVKISYHTLRKTFTEIAEFLNEAHKNEAHIYLYKSFYFLLSTVNKIANSYKGYITNKTDNMEILWESIVLRAKDYYKDTKSYSKFYWRVSVCLKKLIEKIGNDNIEKYIDWYFRVKAPVISYFNPAVFCHGNMTNEFNIDNNSIRVKMSNDDYDKGYEEESKIEEKQIFKNLIERRDAGTLDEYDEELLEYYKKLGWCK